MEGSDITQLDSALSIAAHGLAVFPARDKKPLVAWSDYATTDEKHIRRWWERWPDAEVGVPMPEGTVAVDIDDLNAVKLAESRGELWFVATEGQQTRSGGFHFFYRTDGRPVPQVVKRGGIALDTRSGGKGYVIAYDPEPFDPSRWAEAMEWLYTEVSDPPNVPQTHQILTTRNDILSWLGTFPARGMTLSEAQFRGLLLTRREEGSIVASDPARPWTDDDLAKLAYEASQWEVSKALLPPLLRGEEAVVAQGLAGMDAVDLLKEDIPPMQWAFQGLLQEGLVVLAAPPKAGKSMLAYQMCVHLVMGLDLLGCATTQKPVRYYALEDGKRRSQQRIRGVLAGLGGANLRRGIDLRWTSPKLKGGLEEEIDEYFALNPSGVVVIDVLAKVRPEGKGGKSLNAYDEDYNLLSGLQAVTTNHPGTTVLVVTHDRKAASEDWVTRITGTRGVSGVADAVIYVDRKRDEMIGRIHVTGRDSEDQILAVEFTGSGWRPAAAEALIGGAHPSRQLIFNWLKENGPAWQKAIAEGTGLSPDVVKSRVYDMSKDGILSGGPAGYSVPVKEDDEG
jgi:hypothetical protein